MWLLICWFYLFMQKIKTSDWIINPVFIFSVLLITQICGHIIFSDSFYPLDAKTWGVIAAGVLAYLTGCMLVVSSIVENEVNDCAMGAAPGFVWILLVILLPSYAVFIAAPQVINVITDPGISFTEIRNDLIDSVTANDRMVIYISYIHYAVALACLLAIAYADRLKIEVVIFIAVSGLLASFLTYGRNILLLYFMSIGVILYFQNLISKKIALTALIGFIFFFFAFAYFMGKGGAKAGWIENIAWNFKVYILGGIAAFNSYVEFGEPNNLGPVLLPKFITGIFFISDAQNQPASKFFPFVETPLPVNVYTAFFPWYHDAGIVGVLIGFFLIGLVSMYLFSKRYKSRLNLFAFSISLYPLVMIIFEEQYFRAYPLWGMSFLLIISLLAIEKIKFSLQLVK